MRHKIILIDDEPLILNLIEELMEEEKEFEVASITSTREEFLSFVSKDPYDVAVIDISVEDSEGGFDILKSMKERNINLPAIILSAHDEMHYGLKSLQAGAKAFINKSRICSDLVPALKEVLNGKLFVSGEKGAYILSRYESLLAKGSGHDPRL